MCFGRENFGYSSFRGYTRRGVSSCFHISFWVRLVDYPAGLRNWPHWGHKQEKSFCEITKKLPLRVRLWVPLLVTRYGCHKRDYTQNFRFFPVGVPLHCSGNSYSKGSLIDFCVLGEEIYFFSVGVTCAAQKDT